MGTEIKPLMTIDDFAKLDIRVGLITKAENHPNGTKLLKLTVDFGALGTRTVCAGIREFFKTSDQLAWLEGKRFPFIVNLPPREMRGVVSEGMILAAGTDDKSRLALLEIGMNFKKDNEAFTSDIMFIPAGSKVG